MIVRKLVLTVSAVLAALVALFLLLSVPAFARTGYASTPFISFAPPGGFDEPYGLAVDDSMSLSRGDVYVTDQGNDVVDEFSPEGALLKQASVPGATLNRLTVDDYVGPLEGDVYVAGGNGVVYRFTPGLGTREEFITGVNRPMDVAVDEAGNIFVQEGTFVDEGRGSVLEFNSAGKPVNASGTVVGAGENAIIEGVYEPEAIAVSANGSDLYAGSNKIIKYTLSGGTYVVSDEAFDPETSEAVIVAPTGEVYVDSIPVGSSKDDAYHIEVYEPSGTLVTTTGTGTLSFSSRGLGVNDESGNLYVADADYKEVFVFEPGEMPGMPKTEPYSGLNGSSVVLNGTLAAGTTSYYFDYNKGSSCEGGQATAMVDVSGAGPVYAEVGELTNFTHYSFCLVAVNKYGSVVGSAMSVDTGAVPPKIAGESVSVDVTSATVSAQVDAEGVPTRYFVEYGTSVPYSSKTVEVSVGAGESPVSVATALTGLTPGLLYRFRVVAVNEAGVTQGADVAFTTYPAGTGLPDGRVYEMVTPPEDRKSEVYEEYGAGGDAFYTAFPVQAAAGGDAVAYVGAPSTGGNGLGGNDGGNQYLATRAVDGGWSQATISPADDWGALYQAFSSELSVGFISSSAKPPFDITETLTASVGEEDYKPLYEHTFGVSDYRPLFTVRPPYRSGSEFEAYDVKSGKFEKKLAYAGSSADSSHVLFEANEALLEGGGVLEKELDTEVEKEAVKSKELTKFAEEKETLDHEQEAFPKGSKEYEEKQTEINNKAHEINVFEGANEALDERNELYVSVDGKPSLVNVSPEGKVVPGATFGGPPPGPAGRFQPDFNHVISADGSRIFWTSLKEFFGGDGEVIERSKAVYVREDGSRTVQVSPGPAQFWIASENGKYAFYTEEGKLWRFDVEDETRVELAGSGGSVQAVIGTNETGEEGAYVYFVSQEAISGSGENDAKQKPVEEEDNLYVYEPDPGSPGQSRIVFIGMLSGETDSSDWQIDLGGRTSNLTADGHGLVFASRENLTGASYPGEGSEEVYVYDADDSSLICASCRPQASGGHLGASGSLTYVYRWISEDGNRVFFDSSAPLVAGDINGVQDVYEWERDGSGECREQDGCVYLFSNGFESSTSSLLDASANGNDVFFVTRDRLVPEDQNEDYDLYDARVDGVLSVAPPECAGTACQGPPAPPPAFATPASVTFNGVGNFPPPVSPALSVKKAKPLTRAQKLFESVESVSREA